MTDKIDWASAPDGATHCLIKDSGTAWFRFKDDNSFPNTWKDGEWKNVRLPTRELTPKPKQPKQLTQAVFDGLPPEYRWAAVDRDGDCFVFGAIPEELDGYGWGCEHGTLSNYIGENFNTTDWQNSLIERRESITDVARSIEAARVEERDAVNNPKHYTSHASGIECIQITEHMGFNLGNAVKYIWRCDLKNDAPIEDLEKAIWYIQREIKRRGGV